MFVHPESRGKNIASQILEELESWAKELSFTTCILKQAKIPEAIGLYKKNGYHNYYGQYRNRR
jgi:GNAT superfamily N-acetyltransferase